MKLVLAGGTGHLGQTLARELGRWGHEIVLLARGASDDPRVLRWDGRTLGPWASAVDGADAVINLAGRTVNCRYTEENLRQMMASRVDSTRVVGQAIESARQPPRVWLQMSTATIYAHRFDRANDEATGIIGGNEPDVPDLWNRSIDIAVAWERTLFEANTPSTRRVALRSAMVMGPERGGIFDTLLWITRMGLGGPIAGGRQFVSWIHYLDFVRAVELLLERDEIDGPINLASPRPLPQRQFMALLRRAWGIPIGLPATRWMAEIGAFALRTETELLFKSRRVVPGRLVEYGFIFEHPEWSEASADLVARRRQPSR
jgi:uncharacterized protein (TIGR01777 family)